MDLSNFDPVTKQLSLSYTNVTDADLEHLAVRAPALETLYASSTRIGDVGLKHNDVPITAAGLHALARLKGLTWLRLPAIGITDADFNELSAALPGCQVVR